MAGSDDLSAALARLVSQGQAPDVNIRPVLLRVVVDLFANKPHHAPDEIQQFEAIVSHLLDDAEPEVRALVAGRLASHPQTPSSLTARVIADEPAIAVHAYAQAALDPAALLSTAIWGSADLAEAIARRDDLTAEVTEALAARPEDVVVRALAANPAPVLDRPTFQQLVRRARQDEQLATLLLAHPADPIDLSPLFPLAGPDQRQAIIDAARRMELGRRQWGRLDRATAETLARLDHMVLAGERESFETALSQAIGVSPAVLGPLLQDEGGEILALALGAAGASEEQAARAFILGDAQIGLSVERVRALTQIVATVSAQAARRLITAMTAPPAEALRRSQPARNTTSRRVEPAVDSPAPARREPAPLPARRLG